MGGFTGNDAGVRKVLVAFVGVLSFAAWRQRRRAKKAAKEAKRIAEQHSPAREGYPALRCAICRTQPCSCEAESA